MKLSDLRRNPKPWSLGGTLLVLLAILLAVAVTSGTPLEQVAKRSPLKQENGSATIIELRVDSACATMFAGLSAGPNVKAKLTGKGKHRGIRYYYDGAEIHNFPEPARVSFTFVGKCGNSEWLARSFVIPQFVNDLQFSFCWEARSDTAHCTVVIPTSDEKYTSVWKEGHMTASHTFLIPAMGISLADSLRVEVLSGTQRLGKVALRLPGSQNTRDTQQTTSRSASRQIVAEPTMPDLKALLFIQI